MSCIYRIFAYLIKYGGNFSALRKPFYRKVMGKDIILPSKMAFSHARVILNIGSHIQFSMFMKGTYEKELVGFCSRCLRGGIFIDIGANVGAYALSLYPFASQVYAFEASRRNIRILKSNLKRNSIKNITVLHRAVHNTNNETAALYIDKKETCGGQDSMYRKGGSVENVKTITIDSFCDDNKIENVAVIKIDIEGNELKALQGARKTINRFKPVLICEFNAWTAKQAGFSVKELYDFILSFGYKSFVLKRGIPISFDEHNLTDASFREDMIFIK